MDYGKLALKKLEELQGYLGGIGGETVKQRFSCEKSFPTASSVTSYSQDLIFKTSANGDVTLTVDFSTSRALTLTLMLDGQTVSVESTVSGSHSMVVVCSGVEMGEHIFTATLKGSTFNVTFFKLKADGFISVDDTDIFIQAFDDDKGFIQRVHSEVEIYSYQSDQYSLVGKIKNVKSCRTAMADGKKFLTAIMQTGIAVIIDCQNLSDTAFYCTPVCRNAKAICAVQVHTGVMEIFVVTDTLNHYRFNLESCELVASSKTNASFDDVCAAAQANAVWLAGVKGGYISLDCSVPLASISPKDTFTVKITKEF